MIFKKYCDNIIEMYDLYLHIRIKNNFRVKFLNDISIILFH